MNESTRHLTDEQFANLLAGESPDLRTSGHIAACAFCREELEAVGISLCAFREQTAAWARQVSPARVPVPSRWALGRQGLPSWRTGLTALATAALLAVGLGYTPSHVQSSPSSQRAALPPSNSELAADNRLMLSIDQELGYSTTDSVRASGGQAGAAHPSSQTVQAVAN